MKANIWTKKNMFSQNISKLLHFVPLRVAVAQHTILYTDIFHQDGLSLVAGLVVDIFDKIPRE
jgi:hypothetical protein